MQSKLSNVYEKVRSQLTREILGNAGSVLFEL